MRFPKAALSLFVCSFALAFASETPANFERVIRANDLQALTVLAADHAAAVNGADKLQSTPLHYAAAYGSAQAVGILLRTGANPNAKNAQGVTPLLQGAYSFEKTSLLIEKGADVNAAASGGTTALMIATSVRGNGRTVKYLIEKGADVRAIDKFGGDTLMRSAYSGDVTVLDLLLAKGADAKRADQAGFTALQNAASYPGGRILVEHLLAAGADPNAANTFSGKVKNGPIALTHMTALMFAAPFGNPDTVKALLKAGAKVNELDSRRMTPLMLAVATDRVVPEVVRELIAAGADVNAKDQNGESVLDWADKFRQPEVLSMLKGAGATGRAAAAAIQAPGNSQAVSASAAVVRTLPLLANSGPRFFREGGGCSGCHHQPIYGRTFAAVAAGGGNPDAGLRQNFRDSMMGERPRVFTYSTFLIDTGGLYDPPLHQLEAMSDLREPANAGTDAMVHYIAVQQSQAGSWIGFGIARPPIEESDLSRTATAIRVLREYGWQARREEFDERVKRATAWLREAKAITSYERADQLKGLRAAGISVADLRKDAEELLKLQNANGGWAQTAYLEPDAYATGLVLHTLYANGFLVPTDAAYQKGVAFLLRTQFPDGSWYVKSRAPKFQPYFQSGFPFDHDQWISSTATAWAAMALAPAMEKSVASVRAGEQ